VAKLKTPKSEQHDDDVPVIRGLAGLSPLELRLLSHKEEQDDGKLVRTTTEKSRAAKSSPQRKKDDDEVPIITGTKDANNPSRQEARAGKANAGGCMDSCLVKATPMNYVKTGNLGHARLLLLTMNRIFLLIKISHTYNAYKKDHESWHLSFFVNTLKFRVAVISAKNNKRQRRKRQSVTAKREKSQTSKVS